MWDTYRVATPLEQARLVRRLLHIRGFTHENAAQVVGITPRYVNDLLTLLTAEPEIMSQVESGDLAATEAIKTVRDKRARLRALPKRRTWKRPER